MSKHHNVPPSTLLPESLIANVEVFRSLGALPWRTGHRVLELMEAAERYEAHEDPLARHVGEQVEDSDLGFDSSGAAAFGIEFVIRLRKKLVNLVTALIYAEDPDYLAAAFDISDTAILRRTLEDGRGAVIALWHWDAFQIAPALLLSAGFEVVTLADRKIVKLFDDIGRLYFPSAMKRHTGVGVPDLTCLYRGFKALRSNKAFIVLPELSEGIAIPHLSTNFLGRQILAPEGAAMLARLGPRTILPARLEQDGKFHFSLRFEEPIDVRDAGSVADATRCIFEQLERAVRRDPVRWGGWEIWERLRCTKDRPQ